MTLDDLNNLDPQNIGSWPLPVRIFVILLGCAVLAYAGWHFDIKKQLGELDQLAEKEVTLKQDFENKQKKTANLNALKEQLLEMKQSFGDMVRQLPDQTEVAGLIVDISQAGLATGLQFELFKPGQEKPSEFYAELPISIKVVGDYHQFGEFVSGIAALPRIVTTHDISITKGKDENNLLMDAIMKTYRALGEDD